LFHISNLNIENVGNRMMLMVMIMMMMMMMMMLIDDDDDDDDADDDDHDDDNDETGTFIRKRNRMMGSILKHRAVYLAGEGGSQGHPSTHSETPHKGNARSSLAAVKCNSVNHVHVTTGQNIQPPTPEGAHGSARVLDFEKRAGVGDQIILFILKGSAWGCEDAVEEIGKGAHMQVIRRSRQTG
jgi:hypothetical protein